MPDLDLQILVCVNDRGAEAPRPSCAQGDGLAVYHRLKDLVRERGLRERVMVTRTGCLRRCSHGVTVVAWPGPRWHARVGPGDAAELLDALCTGGALARLAMPDGEWE